MITKNIYGNDLKSYMTNHGHIGSIAWDRLSILPPYLSRYERPETSPEARNIPSARQS